MPNKMERFTNSSRQILYHTEGVAKEFNSAMIQPIHMLLAMTRAPETDAFLALDDYHIVESKLLPFVKIKHPPQSKKVDDIELSETVKRMLELSVVSARGHGHFWIGSGHILVGLMRYEQDEVIADVLEHFSVSRKEIIIRANEYLQDYESHKHEQTAYHHLQITQTPSKKPTKLKTIFRRIFGTVSKRKNNE